MTVTYVSVYSQRGYQGGSSDHPLNKVLTDTIRTYIRKYIICTSRDSTYWIVVIACGLMIEEHWKLHPLIFLVITTGNKVSPGPREALRVSCQVSCGRGVGGEGEGEGEKEVENIKSQPLVRNSSKPEL